MILKSFRGFQIARLRYKIYFITPPRSYLCVALARFVGPQPGLDMNPSQGWTIVRRSKMSQNYQWVPNKSYSLLILKTRFL